LLSRADSSASAHSQLRLARISQSWHR